MGQAGRRGTHPRTLQPKSLAAQGKPLKKPLSQLPALSRGMGAFRQRPWYWPPPAWKRDIFWIKNQNQKTSSGRLLWVFWDQGPVVSLFIKNSTLPFPLEPLPCLLSPPLPPGSLMQRNVHTSALAQPAISVLGSPQASHKESTGSSTEGCLSVCLSLSHTHTYTHKLRNMQVHRGSCLSLTQEHTHTHTHTHK